MKITKNCFRCNKEFKALSYEIKRGRALYCSVKCSNTGRYFSPETRNKISKSRKGKLTRSNNPNWGGGRVVGAGGYIIILQPTHPLCNNHGYIQEHRLVIEKHLGRYLAPTERIHHINHIKADNRLQNLKLLSSNSEHIKNYHSNRARDVYGRFISC